MKREGQTTHSDIPKEGTGGMGRKQESEGANTTQDTAEETQFRVEKRELSALGPMRSVLLRTGSEGRLSLASNLSVLKKGHSGELISPSGRTRPQVAGQLGPWKVLQSPLGTFHIHVLPSAVPASRIGARGCHSIHWTGRKS